MVAVGDSEFPRSPLMPRTTARVLVIGRQIAVTSLARVMVTRVWSS